MLKEIKKSYNYKRYSIDIRVELSPNMRLEYLTIYTPSATLLYSIKYKVAYSDNSVEEEIDNLYLMATYKINAAEQRLKRLGNSSLTFHEEKL